MWTELTTPVVIAHRGDSANAPENTMAAFRMALEKGARAIEFDVKLSLDRQVVVIHDQTVDRTTNGQGDVRHLRLDELKKLNAGIKHGDRFPGEKIPSLEEVFQTIGNAIHMNVELTNYSTPYDGLVEEVSKLVNKYHVENQVLFSSFFARNLKTAMQLLPQIPCGLLAWTGLAGLPARIWGWRKGMYALHPNISDVNEKLVTRIHEAGKRVHVWTVNAKTDLERLTGLGVDGIFTDDPKQFLQLLGRDV